MSTNTDRFALPYLASNQAQKHVTLNESLRRLDGLVHIAVEAWSQDDPPASPLPTEAWHVGPAPTGAWTGHADHVARFTDGTWVFTSPTDGLAVWDKASATLRVYANSVWTDIAGGSDLSNLAQLGVNTAADLTNRLAVKSDAILLSHDDVTPGTGDIEVSINKAATAASAELIFKSNYSARSAVGLAGSDNLTIKVTPNGANWTNAAEFNAFTGELSTQRLTARGNLDVTGDEWRTIQVTVAASSAWGQFKCRRARGTTANPSAVEAGDLLFSLTPEGHDGSSYTIGGGLQFGAESSFSTTRNTYFRMATVHDGVWSERLRVRADGNVGIGTTVPAARLDVVGPIRPGSYARAQLPSASGLLGAMVFVTDAVGGAGLAYSDGSDWRSVRDDANVNG